MFAAIPSFLSALPSRAKIAPRSPTTSFSPPSPTAAYSPPPSPTSFSYPPSPPTWFSSPPPSSPTPTPSIFSSPRSSLYSSPSPSPFPNLFPSSLSSFIPSIYAQPPSYSVPTHFAATAPTRHAIVLNWEDVLAPTSLLTHRVGLQPSHMALENARAMLARDTYLQQALASIEEHTIALLTTAARLGSVFIVTDTSLAYMEATCAIFFPRLAIFLLQANLLTSHTNRIQVVAPPRHLTSAMDVAHWKSTFFQSVCIDQVQRDARHAFSLINVSASHRDALVCVDAAHRAAAALAVPKCVEVANDPQSLETFFAQLQTLHRYLDVAATHHSAFSTRL